MKLTLEQFVKLIYLAEKPVYFYEEEPGIDNQGNAVFEGAELFLIHYSALNPQYVLLPEVCNRTIREIYFCNDGVIRVVLNEED